ncbi:MAG: cytochrome-c oxidase, cbb3-type subunit II [Alphaproteobacteria bacterium]|nr:cytochrome-c oxidase, cbb3-type subunit II [Alphaproteobacteria bacterium]
MSVWEKHKIFETKSMVLLIGTLITVSIGGMVEIMPLYYLDTTIEKVEGVRPYSPLELAGRNIYIREGCYNCHSQMIRSLRDEVERYGPYSLAAESMYDHPFQWGSKRTGPDLARVGGKYSDDWHVAHMIDPRDIVPGSVMPGYPFLMKTPAWSGNIADDMRANRMAGVPYTDAMIATAETDLQAQANPDSDGAEAVAERYPKAVVRDFDGDPEMVSEMDALIAYLQMLGTLVDFSVYDAAGSNLR